MKVLFVPVTYNSYDALESYIASVGKALEAAADPTIEAKIHVADNSTSLKADAHNCQLSIVNYQLSNYPNPGYLPAALKTVYSEDYASYDYIIISNVDVTLDETFFTALRDLKADTDTVWIAPFIWSPSEQRDVNPKIQERYTKKRLRLLRLLFACPPLYYLYTRTLYRIKYSRSEECGVRSENSSEAISTAESSALEVSSLHTPHSTLHEKNIYAGHGSFMIFRPEIFQQEPSLDYPVFLFCEEIYMAEMAQHIGKKVTHCPSVKVWDCEHASTGLMGLWRYCKYNHDALSYIIRTFYEQD
ncbi:MAG: hypothetical protein IKO86_04435 [Prevotella sp.]|nr:hypothetical protein [Prevotella sp.]